MTSVVEKCLVVSRLQETWSVHHDLLLISESLVDLTVSESDSGYRQTILENIWDDTDYEIEAVQFIEKKARHYRQQLASQLNVLHNVDYSDSNWGIVLDAWLIFFLSTAYDCLKKVQYAHQKHPALFIIKANTEANLPPSDAWQFVYYQQSDEFAQMIYIEAARLCGIRIKEPTKAVTLVSVKQPDSVKTNTLKHRLIKLALSNIVKALISLRKPALIIDGYFMREDAIRIMLKSLGKVIFIPSRLFFQKNMSGNAIDYRVRKQLCCQEEDIFDTWVNRLLPLCFPRSFLEDYSSIATSVSKWTQSLSALGTATCQYTSDAYKIAAAAVRRDGSGKLLGFQHGGGYHIFKLGHYDWLETDYVDRYYGWGKPFCHNMGSPKLRYLDNIQQRTKEQRYRGILFVSTNNTRHMFKYIIRENFNTFAGYVLQQLSFYKSLSPEAKKDFIVRPYLRDYGWCYRERWQSQFSGAITFDANSNFYDSLLTARLYVTDHISTTWLEALYSGIPMVIYFSLKRYVLLERVVEIFQQLMEVGVLHETPEEAAAFINSNYENLEAWWRDTKTQRAVKQLKDYTFHQSDHFTKEWVGELTVVSNI